MSCIFLDHSTSRNHAHCRSNVGVIRFLGVDYRRCTVGQLSEVQEWIISNYKLRPIRKAIATMSI